MPRIDPHQLLSCLTPLLASNGGIKSAGEVIRLANLMEKYSKKLVSKCIYLQILKCTETDLLGQFMAAGGWNLVHTWLNDGVNSTNWPFVQEILEMLLLCPVDGNRLKSNHTPKIVKNLSLNMSQNQIITALSKKLVEQWLKIAHQEKQLLQQQQQNGLNGTTVNYNNDENKNFVNNEASPIKTENECVASENVDSNNSNNNHNNNINNVVSTVKNESVDDSPRKTSENVKYKISNKDSGLVLSIKRSTSPIVEHEAKILKSPDSKSSSKSDHKSSKSSDKDRSKKSSSSSSSHKSSSSSKSSHRDKDRSSSHSSSKNSSSSSSKHRDKDSSSSKSSSSSSKHSSSSSRDKEKDREKRKKDLEKEQAEKDKETLNFLAPLPSSKLQRIPKRQHSATEYSEIKSDSDSTSAQKSAKAEVIEKKKPSISIEVRKGDKPKTVKTLNSQFRDHGLAEEPPKPPSRKAIKKTPAPVILPPPVTNNTTSSKPISPPPSKKLHLEKAFEPDVPERAGGVKLIKPKPMLFESTGFLDALDASAMLNKKDTKKRKRLTSGSSSLSSSNNNNSSSNSSNNNKKDEPESPKIEVKPLKFYNDTLEETGETDEKTTTNGTSSSSPTKELETSVNGTDEKTVKDEESKADENKKSEDEKVEVKEEEPEVQRPPGAGTGPDGPPGIISDPNFPKRKRAKRSIRWRSEEELIDVRYFELDENERVNVTKTFNEQKQDEHNRERMMMRSKSVDVIEWHTPKIVDNVPDIPYGSRSLEAAVQAERERNTLQEMFFNNRSMYDSPHEPDPEEYDIVEAPTIPLDDVTGNPDSVNNFKDVQWPAPKGEQPQYISQGGFGSLFGGLGASLTIPPAPVNPTINPLVSFNLGGLQTPLNSQENALNLINMGIIPQALQQTPFMQPPPLMQNNYQSNNNNYSSRGSSNYGSQSSRYDSGSHRNRSSGSSSGSGGSNWVRGNASMRRGMCHQYQRTGYCHKNNCPYIHER